MWFRAKAFCLFNLFYHINQKRSKTKTLKNAKNLVKSPFKLKKFSLIFSKSKNPICYNGYITACVERSLTNEKENHLPKMRTRILCRLGSGVALLGLSKGHHRHSKMGYTRMSRQSSKHRRFTSRAKNQSDVFKSIFQYAI